jgi:hypothetical protein
MNKILLACTLILVAMTGCRTAVNTVETRGHR